MVGPGSRKMGGAGIKAPRPMTPMAGSGLGAPKGGAAMAMGAPPMAPKVANVRPPGMGAGMAPPMPGGAAGLPPNPMSGGGGGMGGSGGFAKGGSAAPQRPQTVQLNRSQMPDKGIMFDDKGNPQDYGLSSSQRAAGLPASPGDVLDRNSPTPAYKKGGSVGIRMGGDTKARHKGTVHKGR